MYYIISFLFVLFHGMTLNVEDHSRPSGKVEYYYEDSPLSLYGKNGEATLYFNKDKFYFNSNTLPQSDIISEEMSTIDFTRGDQFGFPIISDLKNKTTYSRIKIIDQPALLIEPLLEWNWQLIDSTKTIEGFKCFLAKGKRDERVFMAWYCPEISSVAGPKYVWGLPGLILEAFSVDSKERYYLKSLTVNDNIDFLMEIPETKIIFNGFCEYLKKLKKLREHTNKELISEGGVPIDWHKLDTTTGFKEMLEFDKNCL